MAFKKYSTVPLDLMDEQEKPGWVKEAPQETISSVESEEDENKDKLDD